MHVRGTGLFSYLRFLILSPFLSEAHPFSMCHIISLTQSNQSVTELPLKRQIKGPSSELLLMIGPHYIIITLSHPLVLDSESVLLFQAGGEGEVATPSHLLPAFTILLTKSAVCLVPSFH